MSLIEGKWIADDAIDSTKINDSDSYTIAGLTVTGSVTGDLVMANDATVQGDFRVDGTTYMPVIHSEVQLFDQIMVEQNDDQQAAVIKQVNSGASATVMEIENSGTGYALTIDSGNVGFGTTSPTDDLQVIGRITGTDLNATHDATVGNDMVVGGTATMDAASVTNNLSAGGNASVGIDLNVSRDATISGDLVVGDNITGDTLSTTTTASIGTDLNVGRDATISDDLVVSDLLTANSGSISTTLSVGTTHSVGTDLFVSRDATVTDDLVVGDNITGNTLSITTTGSIGTDLNVGRDATVTDDLVVGDNITGDSLSTTTTGSIGTDLNVGRDATIGDDLIVTDRLGVGITSLDGKTHSYTDQTAIAAIRAEHGDSTGIAMEAKVAAGTGTLYNGLKVGTRVFKVDGEGQIWSTASTNIYSPADLAEWCEVEGDLNDYTIGTVVQQSSEELIVKRAEDYDQAYGVVTDRAAFCGNMTGVDGRDLVDMGTEKIERVYNAKRIAMVGHVKVRVSGYVSVGDRLVVKDNGVARTAVSKDEKLFAFGIARQSYHYEGEGLIEVRVL